MSAGGTCNILLACEPLQGVRYVVARERRTKKEYAHFMKDLADKYPDAEKIVVVQDNLNTHSAGAFYETFDAETARPLARKFEFHFTPKKASWLNVAEIKIEWRFTTVKARKKLKRYYENIRN